MLVPDWPIFHQLAIMLGHDILRFVAVGSRYHSSKVLMVRIEGEIIMMLLVWLVRLTVALCLSNKPQRTLLMLVRYVRVHLLTFYSLGDIKDSQSLPALLKPIGEGFFISMIMLLAHPLTRFGHVIGRLRLLLRYACLHTK